MRSRHKTPLCFHQCTQPSKPRLSICGLDSEPTQFFLKILLPSSTALGLFGNPKNMMLIYFEYSQNPIAHSWNCHIEIASSSLTKTLVLSRNIQFLSTSEFLIIDCKSGFILIMLPYAEP